MSKILVFGGKGQLGQSLQAVAEDDKRLIFLSSTVADICNTEQLTALFTSYQPDVAINCAAYTAVDKAEHEIEKAQLLNAQAPAILAKLCKQYNVELIHISTDFVFAGDKTGWLTEMDATEPTGVYGQSKLDGERAIQRIWDKHFIIRTSWLYAEYGNNFVKTMIRLANEKEQLNVVADQVGSPTYAVDLAKVILKIIDFPDRAYGVYHYSNEGVASWYDFAHSIFELGNQLIALSPIPTAAFPTAAKRPAYSVLDKSKIKEQFNIQIPHWRDSLKVCLKKMPISRE